MKPSWRPLAELSTSPQKKKQRVFAVKLSSASRSLADMDPVGVASTGGNKWLGNKKNRVWHRRFRLRKTADQPPTMQSEDKRGPKTITEEWQRSRARPSCRQPPQAALQRTDEEENPLRFMCSLCRDSAEYIPKDLVGHFEDKHRGSPPVFCCQTCTFSTHEFSYLQVHLLSHKDTFSSCALCKDNVQRTWSEFRTHLTAYHFQNGKYSCQMCPKFSTGDVGLFLEHTYAHGLTLEGTQADVHAKEKTKFVVKATAQTLRCQHCGYEVSRKLLINNDIQAVHICARDRLKEEEGEEGGGGRPAVTKASRSSPEKQLRLTRSAVREMCWLTQDCLSLPGREFLDKYCHLSDPHTTLEHTQEFLMQSVAGESADPKWTKALQSVLSNVPQEINLHPMSEKGAAPHASDLTVLTVENKITVAQNGTAYCKKFKSMTSVEKGAAPAQGVGGGGPGARAQSRRRSHRDGSGDATQRGKGGSGQSAPPGRNGATKRKKRSNVRRRRRVGGKKGDRRVAGLPLRIVLKKNPVKQKQWVSQSCEGGPDRLPGLHATPEETPPLLVSESCRSRRTRASKPGSLERCGAVAGAPRVEPERSSHPGLPLNQSLQLVQVDAGVSRQPAAEAGRRDAALRSESTPLRSGGVDLLTSGNQRSGEESLADGGTAGSSSTESAPSQLASALQGKTTGGDLSATVSLEKTDERRREGEAPADSGLDLCSHGDVPTAKAIQPEPSPKSVERTLKLVAISPYQPVRRPAGNQPVVVLNHPDADLPEVARIMEVINRYKGAVRKVALSRRTLNALCAASGAVPGAKAATGGRPHSEGDDCGCVQERFLLKLKLRRLSRKKYQVVDGASPCRDPALSFGCWFCGRVFTSQQMWVIHRQRHLVEWK